MKRLIVSLGLLLGAAVAGFLQAGGLASLGRAVQPAPRARPARDQAPREVNARFRPDVDDLPPPGVRGGRRRPADRRAPPRWDDRESGYRDGASRSYPIRPQDRR